MNPIIFTVIDILFWVLSGYLFYKAGSLRAEMRIKGRIADYLKQEVDALSD